MARRGRPFKNYEFYFYVKNFKFIRFELSTKNETSEKVLLSILNHIVRHTEEKVCLDRELCSKPRCLMLMLHKLHLTTGYIGEHELHMK